MKRLLFSSFFLLFFFGSIAAQDFQITIDAEKDDWYNGLTNPDNGLIFFPARCGLTPDEGSFTLPDNDNDCSAYLWAAWDDTYLYYYAEVTDDIVLVNNSTHYYNDMIEVKYDPDPLVAGTSGALQSRVTALGEDYADVPAGVGNINDDNNLADVDGNIWAPTMDDYARGVTDNGYVLEWRVPLQYINSSTRQINPGVGNIFGTAINVGDNDATQREHMLQWSAGHVDEVWSNPSLHGMVTFMADHILKYEAVSGQDPSVVNDSAAVWYIPANTSVKPNKISDIPSSFNLSQNYPNPFNPTTIIRYNLDKTDLVSLTVYDVNGRIIRNLLSNSMRSAGTHELVFDSKDNDGAALSSGIYFYQIKNATRIITKKMILLR